jgi:DNA-binding GntR family transcriptional regulator
MLTSQPVFFAPPPQRALRNDVYDALRRALVQGALKPGQRINEAEIARQMQISRAPIREAIRQLEQEGLLESVPRRGTFVPSLSRDDVEEVYTLRADLEARAVRRVVPRLTPEELTTLASFVETMCSAGVKRDLAMLLEADIQFHRTIVEAAGWPRLRKLWEGLHPQTLTLYTLNTLTDWSPLDHARRHEPLLAAIQSGDPEAATAAIQEHILGVCAQVIRRLSTPATDRSSPFPTPNP